MPAMIRTSDGTYRGQTVQSIVRRVYGRDAIVRHSRDNNDPYDGLIIRKRKVGTSVTATLIYAEGEWNKDDTDE